MGFEFSQNQESKKRGEEEKKKKESNSKLEFNSTNVLVIIGFPCFTSKAIPGRITPR